MSVIEAEVTSVVSLSMSLAREASQLLLIFAKHFSMLFWLELHGTQKYAKKEEQNKRNNYIENQESKKAAPVLFIMLVLR